MHRLQERGSKGTGNSMRHLPAPVSQKPKSLQTMRGTSESCSSCLRLCSVLDLPAGDPSKVQVNFSKEVGLMTAQEAASRSPIGLAVRYRRRGFNWLFSMKSGSPMGFEPVVKNGESVCRVLSNEEIESARDWMPAPADGEVERHRCKP